MDVLTDRRSDASCERSLDLLVRLGDAVRAGQPMYRLHAQTEGEFELAREACEADPGLAIA